MNPLMADGTRTCEAHPEAIEEAVRDFWRPLTADEVEAMDEAHEDAAARDRWDALNDGH